MQPSVSAETASTLDAYFDELARWSPRLNLTSIPRERMWSRNVSDAQVMLDAATPAPGARVIDIGSGGGAPGIIVAILRRDLRVVLLESDARKGGFLVHVAGLLGLTSVDVETIRAEDAGRRPDMREGFDLATSRAVAPPAVLCELALPLLRVGGSLYALVTGAAQALASCAVAATACGGGPPEAPAPGLLRVGKIAPTTLEYPRRAGVPGKRPIS